MRNNVNMVKEEIKSIKLTFLNQMGRKILFEVEIVGFSSPCSPNIFFFIFQPNFLLPFLFTPHDRVSREEKKRERNKERGLLVISVTAEAFSEGIIPDHSLAYLRRLNAALPLLGDCLHF
ncbi:hypothetical protein M9H77_35011 [Catharanthus roseus]|uniref:Uncharacterized protein n=1 Tax=Catharanthus roseus TaxID=4058 RepID=A0ACB9ZP25_CATRO|nr:hypothetical protein M9H77_35011 [Catharanthus roseus]